MSKSLRTCDPYLKKHGTAENNHWAKDESIVAFWDIHQYDCDFSVRYPPDPNLLKVLSYTYHEGFVLPNQPCDS